MTRMSGNPNWRQVSRDRNFEIAVTPSLAAIANRVTSRYERSLPTSVMSVPCKVVTIGSACLPRSISRAR